jgi:hypothetical protein
MRMRALVALTGLMIAGGVEAVPAQGGGQDTRPGIAVFAFSNGGSYGQQKEDYDAMERGMAGMLISELGANPALRVVERTIRRPRRSASWWEHATPSWAASSISTATSAWTSGW